MKKILFIFFIAFLTSCGNTDKGAENAIEAIKSVLGAPYENATFTAEQSDSLVSPAVLGFFENDLAKAQAMAMQGSISEQQYQAKLDSIAHIQSLLVTSWDDNVTSNELKKDFGSMLRKVYMVHVKGGPEDKNMRVIMDTDGITPFMNDAELLQKLMDME